MKNIIYILVLLAIFSACKKEKTPEPTTTTPTGSTGSSDSATYVITASSNHRRALFAATLYLHTGGSGSPIFTYNFNQPGSVYQDLPITKTVRLHKNDSLRISFLAKNNIPSELTDTNNVWCNLLIKKDGGVFINNTKTVPSTQSSVNNSYTINGQ